MQVEPTRVNIGEIASDIVNYAKDIGGSLEVTATKTKLFVIENWPKLFYYSGIATSALLHHKTFLIGAAWGVFLQCFDTVTHASTWLEPLRHKRWTEKRQYVGGGGLMLTGNILFGSVTAFVAGWGASEEVLDTLKHRVQFIFDQ